MADDLAHVIAKNLRHYREKAGLSQAEVADRADVSRGTVANYEGPTGSMNLETLKQLAKALGVRDIDLAYTGKPPEPRRQEPTLTDALSKIASLVDAVRAGNRNSPIVREALRLFRAKGSKR